MYIFHVQPQFPSVPTLIQVSRIVQISFPSNMEVANHLVQRAAVNGSSDENIGSARGVSTEAFLSTLVVNIVIFAVLVSIFTLLRRLNRRIYAPRTYVGTIEPWRKLKTVDDDGDGYVDEVESVKGFSGLFGWIMSTWRIKSVLIRISCAKGHY